MSRGVAPNYENGVRMYKTLLIKIPTTAGQTEFNFPKTNVLDGAIIRGIYNLPHANGPNNAAAIQSSANPYYITLMNAKNEQIISQLPSGFLDFPDNANIPAFEAEGIDWEKCYVEFPAAPGASTLFLVVAYDDSKKNC